MRTRLTKDLLNYLHSEEFTYLIAEYQDINDWYIFNPVKWDNETFYYRCIYHGCEDHMIFSIKEVLNTFLFEDYLNHEVILPRL